MHSSKISTFKPLMQAASGNGLNAKTQQPLAGKAMSSSNTAKFWLLLGLLIVVCGGWVDSALAKEEIRFERKSPQLEQPWYFRVRGIAVAPDGSVWVADTGNGRIQHFQADGQFIAQFGKQGSGEGQFDVPYGIAIAPDGSVWVADTNNHRIQHLNANGTFIAQFGSEGSGKGQFGHPTAIAIAADGSVWVADINASLSSMYWSNPPSQNNRIQHLNADGGFIAQFGSYGLGNGQFNDPQGIAVAPDGSVWVVDAYDGRVQHFNVNGVFIAKFVSKGSGAGQFSNQTGIAVAPDGSLWVAERGDSRIQHFDANGVLIAQFGSWGEGIGQFWEPWGIAVALDGSVWVSDPSNYSIQHLNANGVVIAKFGSRGQFGDPTGIAVAPDDSAWVADRANISAQHIQTDGVFISRVDISNPYDIAVAPDGSVWVADNSNFNHYKADGQFIAKFEGFRSGADIFLHPTGIAVAPDGSVWVTDSYNYRIQHFNSNGVFITQFGSYGSGEGQFNFPEHIAVAPDGSIWVADSWNNRIQHFKVDGSFIAQFGSEGSGKEQFNKPVGIAVAPDGSVLVADTNNNRIQHLNADGVFIAQIGSAGSGEGQFNEPKGIILTSDGSVWVTDSGNNRIQKFKLIDNPDHSKAIIVAAGSSDSSNELWPATQLNANYAYRTLRSQGYNKDEVRHLSHNTQQDLDFNGQMDDIAGVPSKASLQDAILTWTQASDTDNLVLYLVDHGGDGTFRLSNNETLSTAELDGWLTQLEAAIPTLKHITIIIDACESGSFIRPVGKGLATLSGPKRRIISSAQPAQNAYFLTQGTVSFSNYFWTHLFHGNDLRSAFDHASEVMSAYQTPLVDFNGNGITNEADDLAGLSNQYIGNGVGASSSAPEISAVQASPAVLPLAGGSSAISAVITDGDGVLDAYAIVRPPDFDPGSANNTVTELPKIVLSYNSQTKRHESSGYWDTNAQGDYRYTAGSYPFNHPGNYVLTLYAIDNNYNAAEPKQTTVTVATDKKRRAVIVEGYAQGEELAASFKDNAKLAHDALVRQGYSEDDIYYLSASGLTGVDATATSTNLQYALSQWNVGNTEDLTVYLIADRAQVGNAPGLMLSASEGVTLSQIASWLDTRQSSSGFNQSTGLPYSGLITVILDACYSGEIISTLNLQGKRRVLISSSTPEGAAHFTNHKLLDGQAFSTELSFSRVFWQKVQHGANLRDAFSAAGNAVNLIAGVQTPQLDDNFNGLGNDAGDANTTPALAKDGDLARKFSLGYGVFAAEDQPRILDHTPSGEVQSNQVNLDMNIASTATISDAWAIISRPDYSPDCSAYDQLPKLHLTKDPGKPGHWTADYGKLNVNGDYKITFYAIDQNAQQSQPATATLKRSSAAEASEGAPSTGLFEPNNSLSQANVSIVADSFQTYALETADDQDWISLYAQQGETYTVEATNVGTDIDLGLQLYNAQAQQLKPSLPNSAIDAGQAGEREIFDWQAPASGVYYIKVSNSGHSTGLSNQYQLQVYIAHAPQTGLIKGVITHACNGGTLGGVQVSVHDSGFHTESHSSGVYGLALRAETGGHSYLIDVNATGYQAQSFSQILLPNITTPVDIKLTPVGGCDASNSSSCSAPQVLVNGFCVAPTITCVAPQVLENGICVTPTTCTAPQVLQNNECVTPSNTKPAITPIALEWDAEVGQLLTIPLSVSDAEQDAFTITGKLPSGSSLSTEYTADNGLPTVNFLWTPIAAQANKAYAIKFTAKETLTKTKLSSAPVTAKTRVWPAGNKNQAVSKLIVSISKWAADKLTLKGVVIFNKLVTAAEKADFLSKTDLTINLTQGITGTGGLISSAPITLDAKGNWTLSNIALFAPFSCNATLEFEGAKAARKITGAPKDCVK